MWICDVGIYAYRESQFFGVFLKKEAGFLWKEDKKVTRVNHGNSVFWRNEQEIIKKSPFDLQQTLKDFYKHWDEFMIFWDWDTNHLIGQ